MTLDPYDAVLLVSFGGPEKPDDVVPFLENVTAGKNIPTERLREVGEHYFLFGGRSPLSDQCRELLAAVTKDFAERGIEVAVYWGNRNWDPYLRDTLTRMADDGVRRALCFVTSAYSSYSGCRQYRENLFAALDGVDLSDTITLNRIRHYWNHPGFIGPFVEATSNALATMPADTHVVFVTHSIPESMNEASGGPGRGAYRRQHFDAGTEIMRQVGEHNWSLAYCSRSGPGHIPWLEPDINDHLRELSEQGVSSVVVVPIGFTSDHMEVIFDLDTEASATAMELGLTFTRVATPGTHPDFVAMIGDLALERAALENGQNIEECALGELGVNHNVCPSDCCLNPRAALPAIS